MASLASLTFVQLDLRGGLNAGTRWHSAVADLAKRLAQFSPGEDRQLGRRFAWRCFPSQSHELKGRPGCSVLVRVAQQERVPLSMYLTWQFGFCWRLALQQNLFSALRYWAAVEGTLQPKQLRFIHAHSSTVAPAGPLECVAYITSSCLAGPEEGVASSLVGKAADLVGKRRSCLDVHVIPEEIGVYVWTWMPSARNNRGTSV